jgi:hypothetical protein
MGIIYSINLRLILFCLNAEAIRVRHIVYNLVSPPPISPTSKPLVSDRMLGPDIITAQLTFKLRRDGKSSLRQSIHAMERLV